MTSSAAPPEVPFRESADYSWTEKAFNMLKQGDLQGEMTIRDGIITSCVWGSCPRCNHALDDRQTHTAVTNLMGGTRRGSSGSGTPDGIGIGSVFFAVDVSCGCGNSHPDAPTGTSGCGVSFRVELPLPPVTRRDQP